MLKKLGSHESLLILLAVILLILFICSGVLVNSDGRYYYYPYVHSIVFDRDLDLTNEYRDAGLRHWYYSTKTLTGKAPSVSPVGSPLLVLPFYASLIILVLRFLESLLFS